MADLDEKGLLAAAWEKAYAAFIGAFDTPLARRRFNDEYAIDARKRLREFNDLLAALPDRPQAEGVTRRPEDGDEPSAGGRPLHLHLAHIARRLLARPPELRGPFKIDEESLRKVAGLGPRVSDAPADIDHAPDHGGAPAAGVNIAVAWHEARARHTPDAFEQEFHEKSAAAIRALANGALMDEAGIKALEAAPAAGVTEAMVRHFDAGWRAAISHRAQEADGGWPDVAADLKRGLDNLRARASRGGITSAEVFSLTDPLMDRLARASTSPKGGNDAE
jgi:hypothetical protein